MTDYLINRNGIYYYMRRVPEYVAHIDTRKFVRATLKTKDRREAIRKSVIHNDFIEEYWNSLAKQCDADSQYDSYKLAVKRAKTFSFSYKSVAEIASAPVEKVIERVDSAYKSIEDAQAVDAILGGVKRPKFKISDCMSVYWPLCADKWVGKSDDQIRKWKNPRRLAFNAFEQVIGAEKSLSELTRADILLFRKHLNGRIEAREIIGDTANKTLGYVRDLLVAVSLNNEINIDFKILFSDLKFERQNRSRPSFEAAYVQDTLLNKFNLNGMNKEGQMLIYAMSDTGARDSEIIGLRSEDIFLDDNLPYIWIRPYQGHTLKTRNSERKIPLVGAALYAFRSLPDGFSRYKNSDSASTAVNKFLRENNLKPTPQHCLYSLRHTFKDRLRDIGAPEEIIDELMGHKKSGPKYGRGHLIEKKYQWLNKIAFLPPTLAPTSKR